MFNFRSPSFAKLGIQRDNVGHDDLIELMFGEPRLIRRPVVRIGSQVYFGADTRVLQKLMS
jgi:arsenate reductase-like glutaredoxin family protein